MFANFWFFRIIFTFINLFHWPFKSCLKSNKWCFIRFLIFIKFLYFSVFRRHYNFEKIFIFIYFFMRFMFVMHNQRQIHYHSFTNSKLFLYQFLRDIKIYFITSSALLLIVSMLSLLEYIICSSSPSSLEEMKLIFIVNWIFHMTDFSEIIYDILQVWSNFTTIFLNW